MFDELKEAKYLIKIQKSNTSNTLPKYTKTIVGKFV